MREHPEQQQLPLIIQQYLGRMSKRIRPRHIRADVLSELSNHFADALADTPDGPGRDELAASLISDFGDTKLLAKLIRRAKKRCYPVWLKFVGYTFRAVIIIFLILVGYGIWLTQGEPTISVDYLAKLNEMVRPTADESLNAAPHYLKATELYSPDKDFEAAVRDNQKGPGSALTPERRLALNEWLDKNSSAIAELRLGTTKPYCWFQYKVGPNSESALINVLLPPIDSLRKLGIAICWKMQLAAEKSDWDSVATDIQSLKALARDLMACPALIEQLVGMGIDQSASRQLIYLLQNHHPPGRSLDELAVILGESYPSGYPIADIGCESGFQLDMVQRVFTDDGSGKGHLIPFALDNLLASGGNKVLAFTPAESVARAMIHPSRRETVQIIEQWEKMQDSYRLTTPYKDYSSGHPIDAWFMKTIEENQRNLFIKTVLPATQRAVWYSYTTKAQHEASQIVVALLRYKADHDQFPEKLDELVPQYLKAVPLDPFGPGPLTYKRQGDDFILYSWGLNFEDHGGQHDRDAFRMRSAKGDYVLWPPPVE